jgi:hypothetical protein
MTSTLKQQRIAKEINNSISHMITWSQNKQKQQEMRNKIQ